jgi:hypothetical protein
MVSVDRLFYSIKNSEITSNLIAGNYAAPSNDNLIGRRGGMSGAFVEFYSNIDQYRIVTRRELRSPADGWHIRTSGVFPGDRHLIWIRNYGQSSMPAQYGGISPFTFVFNTVAHELLHAMGMNHADAPDQLPGSYTLTPLFPDVLRILLGGIREEIPDPAGGGPARPWTMGTRPALPEFERTSSDKRVR